MSTPVIVRVRCFGGFWIVIDGKECAGPLRSRGGAILLYFLTTRDGATKERLADTIWRDADGDVAMARASDGLCRLGTFCRRNFGGVEFVVKLGNMFVWNPMVEVDSDRERLRQYAKTRSHETAVLGVREYTGPYLAGELGEWVMAERIAAEWEYISLVELLAVDAWEHRDRAEVLELAARLVRRDATDPIGVYLRMISFAALAQVQMARDSFGLYCTGLERRHARPLPGLVGLERQISEGIWRPPLSLSSPGERRGGAPAGISEVNERLQRSLVWLPMYD